MGYFSEMDVEIREMIEDGFTREQIARSFPILTESDLDAYFNDDADLDDGYDGQPDEAQEWHDFDPDC